MPNKVLPDAGPPVPEADLNRAGDWLVRHGLADARPTLMLAQRLAARHRARLADSVLMAALILGAALAQAIGLMAAGRFGGLQPYRWLPLVVLTVLMVGLVLAKSLLDAWVRRVDRRAAATLSRRVTHPAQLGWRVVLGRPYATFAVAAFVASTVLAASALTVSDAAVRYGAVIVLIGLAGAAAGIVVQMRDLLMRPVVAEDEDSLTADVVMRIEDARERAAPAVVWSMPAVLLFGTTLGWWNAASIVLVLAAVVALHLIHARTVSVNVAARQAVGAQ